MNGDIHTFISLGVLGEYAKSLFASSPCTHEFFPRILRMLLNTFCAFGSRNRNSAGPSEGSFAEFYSD